jgi:hypothetical protein
MHPIQTEVRIADLLALMKTKEVKFYICHHVAFLLKGHLEKNADFADKFAALKQGNIELGMQDLINSGYYYYIYQTDDDGENNLALCSQVVAQLNHYIQKIFFPGIRVFEHGLSDQVLCKCVENPNGMTFNDFQWKSRIGLLEKILEIDPQAVISINL